MLHEIDVNLSNKEPWRLIADVLTTSPCARWVLPSKLLYYVQYRIIFYYDISRVCSIYFLFLCYIYSSHIIHSLWISVCKE